MIATIGFMVGAYIFTRMLAMALDKNTHLAARIFAGLTIPFNLLMMAMLFGQSLQSAMDTLPR